MSNSPTISARVSYEDDQLGAGVDGAGQVVLHLAHVLDDLVAVLRDGGAADALPDRDARVVRRRRAGPEHERLPDQQIDAAPVPQRTRLVYPPHDIVQHLFIGRTRGHERLDLGSQILPKPRLLTHRWNPSLHGTSSTNDNPAPTRRPETAVFPRRAVREPPTRRRASIPRRTPTCPTPG